MSGHSHWSSIKHKKGLADAKRGQAFSKIVRLIMQAVREGGTDIITNSKLRLAIDKSREVNMAKDKVESAIKKASGEGVAIRYEDATYEGFGPGDSAILVKVITDNKNRTISELRKIFDNKGGRMTGVNSVARMFDMKGFITVPSDKIKEDDMLVIVLDIGTENLNMEVGDGVYEITCAPRDLDKVKKALIEKGQDVKSAELSQVPNQFTEVSSEVMNKIVNLMEALEEHDDVQEVFSNFEVKE